jgi:hypothetical protein
MSTRSFGSSSVRGMAYLSVRIVPGSPFVNSFPYSYLRISWGKSNKIEQFEKLEKDNLDWTESVIVYGIAGMVELFTCVCL